MEINVESIKRSFEENPAAFMMAAGTLLMGISKIVEATGHARGSHAFARQVNHRIRMAKKS